MIFCYLFQAQIKTFMDNMFDKIYNVPRALQLIRKFERWGYFYEENKLLSIVRIVVSTTSTVRLISLFWTLIIVMLDF